jgi:hypothetical protein
MLNPVKRIPNVTTVSCLIDEATSSWIPETVNAFFDPDSTEQILSIQVSRHGDYFVHWPHSKHGLYTVRSAYSLARSERFFV